MTVVAETDRLLLRLWEPNEIQTFCELCDDEGLSSFSVGTYREMNPEKAKAWIQAERVRFETFRLGKMAVELKSEKRVIGIAGLFQMPAPNDSFIEVAYRLLAEHWGKGLGSEAAAAMLKYGFAQLELDHIHAVTDPQNFPSKRVLEKLGMRNIGQVQYLTLLGEHWQLSRKKFYNF